MEGDRRKSKRARGGKSESASLSEKGKGAAAAGSKQDRRRFEIDVFRDWCKCCGICAAFCPLECIALDDEGAPTMVDSNRCSGCGWCELHCPDFAISVHRRDGEQ
jgi:2-oxoglutarate ferredoxin oxidoreductase subunit delta